MDNEVDAFLDDVNTNPDDVFDKKESSPFGDEVTTGETKKDVEETVLPFHKDPKVQRYVEKEISKALKDIKPVAPQQERVSSEGEPNELVDAFANLIGNDTPEKRAVLKAVEKQFEKVREEAVLETQQAFQAQSEAQAESERQASLQLDEYFEEIEETYNVDLTSNTPQVRKNRAEFVEFIKKISPKNREGEVTEFPDLVAAYDVYKDTKKTAPTNTRAKELAARSMTRSGDASVEKKTGGNSWKAVDALLSKLTG